MKRSWQYLLFFLLPVLTMGQPEENAGKLIDSLKQVVRSAAEDTQKVNALANLGYQLRNTKPKEGLKFATDALQLAEKLQYPHGVALACLRLGTLHMHFKRNEEADKYFQKSILISAQNYDLQTLAQSVYMWGTFANSMYEEEKAVSLYKVANRLFLSLKDKKGIADVRTSMGLIEKNKGNYHEALKYYTEALNTNEEIHNSEGAALIHNNMGVVYKHLGNYPEALNHYFAALKIRERNGQKKGIGTTLYNIGIIYQSQRNHEAALANYTKALQIKTETDDKIGIANCYNAMGIVFLGQRKMDKALESHLHALKIREEIQDKNGISHSYNNIGSVHYKLKNYPEALSYYKRSLAIKEKSKDKQGIAATCNNLAMVYIEQKDLQSATAYLEKAFTNARLTRSKEDIIGSYKNYVKIDSLSGNMKKCLADYKIYIAYRDSIFNEENTKKATQSEMQYGFDKKEEATRLEQEKKEAVAGAESRKQRIILLAISGFGLLILGFAIFAYRSFLQKKKANTEISKQKDLIEEKQKEILDSIYYARRIQRSLLTGEKYITRELNRLNGLS